MTISRKDVEHVATLARLKLSDEESERMTQEIGAILQYVHRLDSLDLQDVPPTYHTLDMQQAMRSDEPKPSLNRTDALENAPEEDGSFFIVPKVV